MQTAAGPVKGKGKGAGRGGRGQTTKKKKKGTGTDDGDGDKDNAGDEQTAATTKTGKGKKNVDPDEAVSCIWCPDLEFTRSEFPTNGNKCFPHKRGVESLSDWSIPTPRRYHLIIVKVRVIVYILF